MDRGPVPLRHLTRADVLATVEGGTEGSAKDAKHPPSVSSAVATPSQARMLATALDALSAMFSGYVSLDRELLDTGFEDLVGVVEEWRDAVPKA